MTQTNTTTYSNPEQFLEQLEHIYKTITSNPNNATECRRLGDSLIYQAFKTVPIRISGLNNLPASPGHIFVLNHHKVHPFYTLANGFQITLDTHFLSALLAHHYPEVTSTRVVRTGRQEEQAHKRYFDQFNFIMVTTKESGQATRANTKQSDQFQQFKQQAESELKAGNNLILCPEGTSYECHESPGPFKSGAFRLALELEIEPYIIPVSIAHFDKVFDQFKPAMTIHNPIKLSDHVEKNDREQLSEFVKSLNGKYHNFIEFTRNL